MKLITTIKKIIGIFAAFIVVLPIFLFLFISDANALTLTNKYLNLSDSRPSNTPVSYTLGFQNVSGTTHKCISLFFINSLEDFTKPTGLDITNATFSSSSTYVPTPSAWTVTNDNSSGSIIIKYSTGEIASNGTIVLDGITNGSNTSINHYIRIFTFGDLACDFSPKEDGVFTFLYTDGVSMNATVDPTLTFSLGNVGTSQSVNGATTNVATVSATAVTFGSVTAATNKIAAHDLIVSTNAITGYTVYVKYTGILTSGGNTITDHTGSNASPTTFVSPGTEGFGYTTNDATLGTGTAARFTTSGGNKWAAYTTSFTPSNEVAYSSAAVASETTRVGYQVSVNGTTEIGTYTTTVVYSAIPKY